MSTFTVVSDIHGNYPALEAVLNDAPDTDGLICLGDLIGLCGFPQEVVATLQSEATHCLQGNHDLAVIEWGEGHVNDEALSYFELEHTLEILPHNEQMWVNDRPTYLELEEEGILAAHAQPTPELSSGFERGNAGVTTGDFVTVGARAPQWVDIMLLGHIHEQHAVDTSQFHGDHDVLVVNPGSVGQPLSTGRAEYAIVDTDDRSVKLHSVEYDTDVVIDRLDELDVPKRWWG